MGAESRSSLAKGNTFPSDRSNAPLLPRPAETCHTASGSAVATQPPLPVVTVQGDSDSDLYVKGRATPDGYHTGICHCCTQPGGAQLCKQSSILQQH